MVKQPAREQIPESSLHTTLQAALNCMDVQLEAELARYRRQRAATPPLGTPVASPEAAVVNTAVSNSGASATVSNTNDIADLTRPRPPAPSLEAATPAPPEDDLESSQQLRRNLPPAKPATTPPGRRDVPAGTLRDRLLTPLGVGSLLVLGVTGMLLGSALLAPESLEQLTGAWLGTDTPEPSATTEAEAGGFDVGGPNLANDEFNPLDLDALSTLEASPSPAAAVPGTAPETPPVRIENPPGTVPALESDLTTALLSPTAPEPDAEPSPQPSPSPNLEDDPAVANAVPGPAAGDRFYYVVVSYGGEESLRQARGIVPEAYLRRFPQGVQIQMGAFGSEADAQALVNRLQQQGITSSVFRRE